VVRALIDEVFKALRPQRVTANIGAQRKALRSVDEKIAHLTVAIETGAALAPIVEKLQMWRELLSSNPQQVLRETLDGPLTFIRVGKQYRIEGATTTGKQIAALVGLTPLFWRPQTEPHPTRTSNCSGIFARPDWRRAGTDGVVYSWNHSLVRGDEGRD
jgi:hypothetical protein